MRKRLVLALVLASGCAGASTRTPPGSPGATAPDAPGATAADTPAAAPKLDASACGPEIAGAEAVIAPGAIVMLGEMHGNQEMPAFTGNLACRAAVAGHAVIVGVEIPQVEQAALDRYLASHGTDADRQALVRGQHWQRPDQDGRSSQAMVELVERVRWLRQHGLTGDVLAFDTGKYGDWNARDAGMGAAIVARAAQAPDAFVVTLSGNLHNRTVPGLPWDASLVPMGVHVKAGHARTLSLDARYEGGTTWMCQPDGSCGAKELTRKEFPWDALAIDTSEAVRNPGIDGVFFVGTLSASPPAVPAAGAASPPAVPAAGAASPPAVPAAGAASPQP